MSMIIWTAKFFSALIIDQQSFFTENKLAISKELVQKNDYSMVGEVEIGLQVKSYQIKDTFSLY